MTSKIQTLINNPEKFAEAITNYVSGFSYESIGLRGLYKNEGLANWRIARFGTTANTQIVSLTGYQQSMWQIATTAQIR